MSLRILHTNDFHGKLTQELVAEIQSIRSQDPSCLYFDTGDVIKAGNLAIPLRPEPAWSLLAEAGCDASVPGNRESHILEAAFRAKIAGLNHPLLCANFYDRRGDRVLAPYRILTKSGLRVGVFGLMVPMVTAQMAARAASAYLWTQPIAEANQIVPELRSQCDLVVALTHIGYRRDIELAQTAPGIDIILGGHSHTILEHPVQEGKTFIAQGGSHGRFLGDYRWEDGKLTGGLLSIGKSNPANSSKHPQSLG